MSTTPAVASAEHCGTSRNIILTPVSRKTPNQDARSDYNRERQFFLSGERQPCWDGRKSARVKDASKHPKPGDYFMFVINSSEETARAQVFQVWDVKEQSYRLDVWPDKYDYSGGVAEATGRPFLELSRYLFTCSWRVLKEKLKMKENHSPQGTSHISAERVAGGLTYLDRLRDKWQRNLTEVTWGKVAGVDSDTEVPDDGIREGAPTLEPILHRIDSTESEQSDRSSKFKKEFDESSPNKRARVDDEASKGAADLSRVAATHIQQTLRTLKRDPLVSQYLSESGLSFEDLVHDIVQGDMGGSVGNTAGSDADSDRGLFGTDSDDDESDIEGGGHCNRADQAENTADGDGNPGGGGDSDESGVERVGSPASQKSLAVQSQRTVRLDPLEHLSRLNKVALAVHRRWNEAHKVGGAVEEYKKEAEVCRELRKIFGVHCDSSDFSAYFDFQQEDKQNFRFMRRYNRRSTLGKRPDFAGRYGTLIEVKMYRDRACFPRLRAQLNDYIRYKWRAILVIIIDLTQLKSKRKRKCETERFSCRGFLQSSGRVDATTTPTLHKLTEFPLVRFLVLRPMDGSWFTGSPHACHAGTKPVCLCVHPTTPELPPSGVEPDVHPTGELGPMAEPDGPPIAELDV